MEMEKEVKSKISELNQTELTDLKTKLIAHINTKPRTNDIDMDNYIQKYLDIRTHFTDYLITKGLTYIEAREELFKVLQEAISQQRRSVDSKPFAKS